jgi:hypothetical protein
LTRKIALSIALVILISISISYFIWFRYTHRDSHPRYERTIVRNISTVEEANALTFAENSNYTDIFNLQRFETWDNNKPWAYTWANFIDTQVIQYYDDRFENSKGKLGNRRPEGIKFHYKANVSTWNQIRVVYIPAPDAIQVLSLNGSILFEKAVYSGRVTGMKFAYRNDSEYQMITAEEIDFSLSKSCVVEMILEYCEYWGPLAAFSVRVHQIVIVDQDFLPLLFGVQCSQGVS